MHQSHEAQPGLFTTQDRYEPAYVALTTALQGIDTDKVELTMF
jgi:hypothetical protein